MSRDRDEATDKDVEDYWLPLLKTGGQWDEQKIRAELHDLVFVANQVSALYDHVSGGKLSKPMYYADVIKAEFDDAVNKAYEEGAARVRELEAEVQSLRTCLAWKTKQRLKAATDSEKIGLFLCSDEDRQGESGSAINERGEVFDWWEHLGALDVSPGVMDATDPEYLAARAEVGLDNQDA